MNLAIIRWCMARAFVVGLALLLTHPLFAAETVGPVTDAIGVVKIPKGAPILIGAYWVISGADTALGLDSKRGAELGFRNIGDKLTVIRSSSRSRSIRQRRGRPDRGDQAGIQPADLDRARWRLLQCRHAGRADPVAAGHHQHLQRLLGAVADRARSRAAI